MEKTQKQTEKQESNFLQEGDTFSVEATKTFAGKRYGNMIVKILTTDGNEKVSSAACIVKILTELKEMYDHETVFKVVKKGTFNDNPILSLITEDEATNKEIRKLLF